MTYIRRPSGRAITLLFAAPFIAVACTSAADSETSDSAAADGTVEVAAEGTQVPSAETETPISAADTWLDIELTDAASGETFTLASLEGEVVAIEPMAIWCSNCKAQQDNVKSAFADIEAAGVRYISLGVDPNESLGALAKYADRRGYEWTFAQSPTEFSRAINDIFGAQILSVPSTPLIVLDGSGEIVYQDFGFHGPDALVKILDEAAA